MALAVSQFASGVKASGGQLWDPLTKMYVDGNSLRGQALKAERQKVFNTTTKPIVEGERAVQNAEIGVQEAEDVMRLNQQAAAQTNALAMSRGNKRVVGGGSFQNNSVNANSAIAGLNSANARIAAGKKRDAVDASLASPTGQMTAVGKFASAVKGLR